MASGDGPGPTSSSPEQVGSLAALAQPAVEIVSLARDREGGSNSNEANAPGSAAAAQRRETNANLSLSPYAVLRFLETTL